MASADPTCSTGDKSGERTGHGRVRATLEQFLLYAEHYLAGKLPLGRILHGGRGVSYISERKDSQTTEITLPNHLLQQHVYLISTTTRDDTYQACQKSSNGKVQNVRMYT
ncbi:hypothetical protein TNCV_1587351 [Trichonephila clavipes]|uniref:Uncharacterized protein n=1 Tax=Trichonephila clavipes TaxID=2585209 RepID=A0A8X6V3B5_TRICX|nr:hypothetical protein TNCV_1587351 [Trichonephila clavipes]